MNTAEYCEGLYYTPLQNGKVQCDMCPRYCKLSDGQRGFCYVRMNQKGKIVLTSYGRSSGFCIDPIEKKPLNHFYPGSSVLSFGTAGCNLGCKFCQNWDISKAKTFDKLQSKASPEKIALAAKQHGCKSVAYTYNDPVIFTEYAIDTSLACHEIGIKTVAVSAGYMTEIVRPKFFEHLDATNIDLKGFTSGFYKKLCYGNLEPVLETLEYLHQETSVWLEITTLLIPGENDSETEIHEECQWITEHLGTHVPLHFTAFHPDFKMRDKTYTPEETLLNARQIALQYGLNFVYIGNVNNTFASSTYCPKCKHRVIERNGYELGDYQISEHGACTQCKNMLPGHFQHEKGYWGSQRKTVQIFE